MDNKKKIIKAIYENAVETFELSKKQSEKRRVFDSFIEEEALSGVFAGDDEGFANEIASEVIMRLSEKEDLDGFFNKVKELKSNVEKIDDSINDIKQKNFLLAKQAVEYSVSGMDVDILRVEMTRHPRWHKIQNDVQELCKEHNFPVSFSGGKAYIATYPLNESSPKEYLGSLIKHSESKGNFLRAVLKEEGAISKVKKEDMNDFVISNNTLINIKTIQMMPKAFEEDIMKATSEGLENKNKNSIKNK